MSASPSALNSAPPAADAPVVAASGEFQLELIASEDIPRLDPRPRHANGVAGKVAGARITHDLAWLFRTAGRDAGRAAVLDAGAAAGLRLELNFAAGNEVSPAALPTSEPKRAGRWTNKNFDPLPPAVVLLQLIDLAEFWSGDGSSPDRQRLWELPSRVPAADRGRLGWGPARRTGRRGSARR